MGSIPSSHKGRKRRCDICGAEYGERENKLFRQRGLWVDRDCFDSVLDKDRVKSKGG